MPKKLSPEAAEKARKNGKLGGKPRIEIDYESLTKLCSILCTGEECASILGIDYETLNRRLKQDGHGGFKDFFKKHSANGKASLRRMQFQAAQKGNSTMLIWLGKQHLGQKDRIENDHLSSDGSMTPKKIERIIVHATDTESTD